jgi:D-alanyl-D-alanine carboxypeptidase/D-alanyl-D-alanine-endopeptidase (penicillin-binding protein 4)
MRASAWRKWLAVALLALASLPAAAALPAPVQQALTRFKIPSDAVSILVQAVDEDTPRLALNIDTPRNPASTAKVVTTWTALDLLGPTHTWPTRVYRRGTLADGVLQGDLIIKGYGDPYFVIEDLWGLLGQVRRAGVRDITGDLIIDDTHFAIEETDAYAFDGQGDRLYNVLPNALIVNFKSIDFVFRADRARGQVEISTVPPLPNLDIVNHIRLTSEACRGNALVVFMRTPDPTREDQVEFGGKMPAACGSFQLARSAMSPAAYNFGAFKFLWQNWGGSIAGGYRRAATPAGARQVATWTSRPLAELIRPLNKWSNNLMARMLLIGLADHAHRPPLSRAQGEATLLKHLAARGLETKDLNIDNGSGLSRTNRISARFMVALLRRAWREPTMPEFLSSFAVAGLDGTVRRRFRQAPQRGHMHLKTGSLAQVSAVAGYVHAASGKVFAVDVMINYANANYGVGIAIQDAVLGWAFKQ